MTAPEFVEPKDKDHAYEIDWFGAPVVYRHWRKGLQRIHQTGDWCYPEVTWEHEEMRDWVHVGWAPKPRGRRQAFLHHYRHGRLMGYPFLSVLLFALKYSAIGR